MKKSTAALALSAALMTGAAQAATVSFTAVSPRGNDFTIGRFDTGLGTMTGVAIDLFATARAFDIEEGNGYFPVTASAYIDIKVMFAGLEFSDHASGSASYNCGFFCYVTAIAVATIDVSGDVYPDFGLVSGVGPGTLPVDLTFSFDPWADSHYATLAVTYTYDEPVAPVPLPAAGGLMLAGLGGLALLRRRTGAAQWPGRS